jgi:hypothetical protein
MLWQILLGVVLGVLFAALWIYFSERLDELFPEERPEQKLRRIAKQADDDMAEASRRYRAYVDRATKPYIKSEPTYRPIRTRRKR